MIDRIMGIMRRAGEIILSAHSSAGVYDAKPGKSNFVTKYDLEVQKMLMEEFAKLLPEAGFVGEEGNCDICAGGLRFIVDPIDGTTNFMHNYQKSAISAGLADGDRILLGAVYNPYSNEMFHAESGAGAFLNGAAISTASRQLKDGLVCFGTSPYYADRADATFEMAKNMFLNARDIRRSGSAALDLCDVACGRCDLFFEHILSPWDYAAAALIIQEAGGVITTMDGATVDFRGACSILAGSKSAIAGFRRIYPKG